MADLKELMATSATGYGAVIDGILNIRTVTDTANAAAFNALYLSGVAVLSNCNDPDCTCKLDVLARIRPDIKIVPVSVRAD
jgi:hypothetical protein